MWCLELREVGGGWERERERYHVRADLLASDLVVDDHFGCVAGGVYWRWGGVDISSSASWWRSSSRRRCSEVTLRSWAASPVPARV